MNLDPIDCEILNLLLEDGRMSFNDIAKQTGVSTPTVSSRLRHLEEDGIIRGFHASVDQDKLDQLSVLCTMEPHQGMADKLIDKLVGNEMVREVYDLDAGKIQIKATLPGGADIRVLLELLNDRELIRKYTWNVIVRTHKEMTRGYINHGTGLNQPCMYCKGPIHGNPIKKRVDGRTRLFCCAICQREFMKRYREIQGRADSP
jgi:Lrp/AsnC family leucine-responsive transcriptional regulator